MDKLNDEDMGMMLLHLYTQASHVVVSQLWLRRWKWHKQWVGRQSQSVKTENGMYAGRDQENFATCTVLDLCSFKNLLRIIMPKSYTLYKFKTKNSAGSEVFVDILLGLALRYMAGGSVWDIQSNYEISVKEFYRSVWRVLEDINVAFLKSMSTLLTKNDWKTLSGALD